MRINCFSNFRGFVGSFLWIIAFFLWGCSSSSDTLFELIPGKESGITFANTLFESDTLNIFTYDYIYNGGGVAISDFNNDGLQDVFFTGNMVSNRLYINQGNFSFQDVTEKAHVNLPDKWNCGVTVVDINNDGWQDIYICSTMNEDSLKRANMLFVNQGVDENNIPVFEELAGQYGIADTGHSLTAAFFDYDRDGDLDLYVLTNKQSNTVASNYRPKVIDGSSPTTDRLYRNNGDLTFTNVSNEAGVVYEGFGLGLAVSDFNNDGWPDIYVSNDFITNDVLYINNQNGTFFNASPQVIAHQSHSSMGSDAADFNNDGLTDIITMDMLPETNERKKTSINNKNYLNYIHNETFHYEYQYMRNMLHYNNGMDQGVGFSEIGQMAGIFQTEWSWSSLFADFDNDGFRDLVITNGFPKDITDKDFVNFRTEVGAYMSNSSLADSVPVVKIPNYIYKNNGDMTFTDMSKSWGFSQPSFSNGAAFADLDNDGDLDYIVNNINQEAFVYRNTLCDNAHIDSTHYIRIKLKGPQMNRQGIGAKVFVHYNGKMQYHDHAVSRGYLSSVEETIHFGLGSASKIDSLIVRWTDGKVQKLKEQKSDRVLEITYDASAPQLPIDAHRKDTGKLFVNVTDVLSLQFIHQEKDKIDFNLQRTLPHKFSQQGPGVCVGDVNNDQLDDIIIGGSVDHQTMLFVQGRDGKFSAPTPIQKSSKSEEDEGLLLFDADADGDQDLYLVSGSLESDPKTDSMFYQDRLLLNDGKGNFKISPAALPPMVASGSCVRSADIDGDGDLDLFVGGRVVPARYPYAPQSFLLINDKGRFENRTPTLCPELSTIGMVTDGLFTDFNNDGKIDLIVVGEFMSISIFENLGTGFALVKDPGVMSYTGWWSSIVGGDFDHDNDIDYVVGNLGLNNSYQVSPEHPLEVYAKDFDNNESVDAIMACHIKTSLTDDRKELFPIHFWDEMVSQSPRFRKQFSSYKQYGKTTMAELFTKEELSDALHLSANYFQSSYMENLGNGKFKLTPLPLLAQVSPVNGMVVEDFNNDSHLDVALIGNDYGNEVFSGRLDASTGLILFGDGKGQFSHQTSRHSGFEVMGDTKGLVQFWGPNGELRLLATRNRDSIKVLEANMAKKYSVLPLQFLDSWGELVYSNGHIQRVEFYYGSGYLSQSSRKLKVPHGVKEIIIHSFSGEIRRISAAVLP